MDFPKDDHDGQPFGSVAPAAPAPRFTSPRSMRDVFWQLLGLVPLAIGLSITTTAIGMKGWFPIAFSFGVGLAYAYVMPRLLWVRRMRIEERKIDVRTRSY